MSSTHTCKNCGNNFTGKYCNNCGEKVQHQHDKKLLHILEEAFHFITHFEGSFFNTLKAIVTSPGKFSKDYCNGIRKKYFKPISFFLMLVILYLLFPIFEGLNMQLEYHLNTIYGSYASKKSDAIAAAKGISMEQLSEIFHRKGEKTSKFLLFILLPVLALVSMFLGSRKRKLYYDHFIFSTEIMSFFILWGYLILPMIFLAIIKIIRVDFSEEIIGVIIMAGVFIYLFIAARRFFEFRWWYAIIFTLLLMFFQMIFIEWVYKFLLFFISIHLV